MEVIPSIDILEGRCVRLLRGDFTHVTTYSDDPIEVALHWCEEGAARLHVVDLDGARAAEPAQRDLILRLIKSVGARARVQAGGGLRRPEDVRSYLDGGADRVILGSAALKDQEALVRACRDFPDRVVAAIDALDGKVTAEAWHELSEEDAIDLAQELEAAGVSRFLYTDIARDGALAGPNLSALRAFVEALASPVIASGGVATLDDVGRVAAAGAEAVVIGRALYEGVISLPRALDSAKMAG